MGFGLEWSGRVGWDGVWGGGGGGGEELTGELEALMGKGKRYRRKYFRKLANKSIDVHDRNLQLLLNSLQLSSRGTNLTPQIM